MSLTYVVDGYNAIKRSSLFKGKTLRESREAFFRYLDSHRPHGSLRNRLVIILDGSCEVCDWRHDYRFEIVFTKGRSADEAIKEMAQVSPSPKETVVVTDDKALACAVRRQGIKIMGTEEFLTKKRVSPLRTLPRQVRGDAETAPELNAVEREAITEELKALWLKKKSS